MDVSILYPVLMQVSLTFFLQFWMGYERLKAVRAGTVQRGANSGQKAVWPERAGVVSNAFNNQLEVPMLFYAVVAFAMITSCVDQAMIMLAWAFVGFRLLHAFIYTTYNYVPHRFLAYLFGSIVVAFMWVRLGLHVLSASV